MHRFSLKKIYWIIIVSIHIDVIGPLIKNIEVKFPPSVNYSTLHNAQLCKETLNDWSFVRNQNIRGAAEILKSTSGWIRNSCTVYDPFFFFLQVCEGIRNKNRNCCQRSNFIPLSEAHVTESSSSASRKVFLKYRNWHTDSLTCQISCVSEWKKTSVYRSYLAHLESHY